MNNEILPQYNYPVGTIIRIDGRAHHAPKELFPGRLTIIDVNSGQPFLIPDPADGTAFPTPSDFDALILEGRIEVEIPENVVASRMLASKAEWDWADLEALDPGVRKVWTQMTLLDENGVKNGLKAVTEGLERYWSSELKAKFGPHDSPSAVKRWRMERGKPGMRLPKLCVRLTGKVPRQPHDSDVPHEIRMKHALDCKSNGGTMKSIYALARAELVAVNEGRSKDYPQPEIPYPVFGYHTFRRDCILVEGSDTIEARDGKDLVQSRMRGAGKPLTASKILEFVIIDHTPLDCFVVIDTERDIIAGHPTLTLGVDVHSRAAPSATLAFRPPSYWTVCESLRRMTLPKRPPAAEAERYPVLKRICGKPNELILDNAPEFTGHGLEDAAKCGSFSVRFCPIGSPRYRAIGERALSTIPKRMLELLHGRTMPIKESRRARYDAKGRAVVTMEELEALLNKALAEYHTEPHDGLNGLQPALVWQKSANRHGIDVMHDIRRFQLECYETKHNVQVTKSGVRIFGGLRYHDAKKVPIIIDNCLSKEPSRPNREDIAITTRIKYDPENISVIYVFDKTTLEYVELKCEDETYADGMPLWFHEELLEIAKREATAPPKETAKPRTKKRQKLDESYIQSIAEWEADGVAPQGFNTEQERLEARARRIEAVRAIAPNARERARQTLAKLNDTPRLRQITGNIVHLTTDYAEVVTTDDFISHDVSSLTALDLELLAPRPAKRPVPPRLGKGDRREVGMSRPKAGTSSASPDADNHVGRRQRARG